MSLIKLRKKLNPKSSEVQEILVERLNKLCEFLDLEYDINAGGCCFVTYCLARLLSRDKFRFKVVIYEEEPLENKFDEVSGSHWHYAIELGNLIINDYGCEHDHTLYKNVYKGVKASQILEHYQTRGWNNLYNSNKNSFIFKTIKVFYNDLTEDLREE